MAKIIPNKNEETLAHAIDEIRVRPHGPMKELILDGEPGIDASDYTNTYLRRKGIRLNVRAQDQHAQYVERREAICRYVIHRVEEQLKLQGPTYPFDLILSEAIFAGNAMLTVNGSTPYNAVYGRVPRMLPGTWTRIDSEK